MQELLSFYVSNSFIRNACILQALSSAAITREGYYPSELSLGSLQPFHTLPRSSLTEMSKAVMMLSAES